VSRYRWRSHLGARAAIGWVVAATILISLSQIAGAQAQPDEERFDFIVKSPATPTGHVGTATYDRTLPGGGAWLDGDRVGYRVVYGFLDCRPANPRLNLRVAAHGYTTATATQILDRFMDEGSRTWDGTVEPDGEIPARDSDAPRPESHGASYPTSVPRIEVVSASGNTTCEIRDYANVVDPAADLTWAVIEESRTQAIIGWFVDGEPAAEFYYDILDGPWHLEVTGS
jgi:hypothetical protein